MFCAVSVVFVAVAAVLIFVISNGNSSVSDASDVDRSQSAYSTVKVLEEKSGTEESSYRVGADLQGSDFSALGQTLTDKIRQEWNTYDGLDEMQRVASSKAWGYVGYQCDTWSECEEAIGMTVTNPLENSENIDGLVRSVNSGSDKHIQVNVSTQSDRTPSRINIMAQYNIGSIRITLTASLSANSETYTSGGVYTGYADFKQNTAVTGSGIPVLTVTADGENNLDYYAEDYYDPTAYWVKDNVFYSVRVLGTDIQKERVMYVLDMILKEF